MFCGRAALALALVGSRAEAQFDSTSPSNLSDAVQVDEASSAVRALLERANAHAANKQWDEAIDMYRQVMEHEGGKLTRLDPRHFVTLRTYCQMELARLPREGLTLYRSRVDAIAKRWYDRGVAGRDSKLLGRVVDEFFVSSWGDAALWKLGTMALEQGNYRQARWCWERISPALRSPDGEPLWLKLRLGQAQGKPLGKTAAAPPPTTKEARPLPRWLAYPDTKLNLADVRARLVLVSIMEGSLARARVELADFVRRDPGAKGRMAGRDAPYAETLTRLLTLAEARPPAAPRKDWPTFAGSFERTAIAEAPRSPGHLLWEIPLAGGKPFQSDPSVWEAVTKSKWPLPRIRPADENQALLCFYPLIVGHLVLLDTADKVFAFDLATGKPAWPVKRLPGAAPRAAGEIYSSLKDGDQPADQPGDGHVFQALGAPRFTMTAADGRLYARLGSPISGVVGGGDPGLSSDDLVCLDLQAQGLLVWRVASNKPPETRWSFEGAPVVDGDNVYIVMRYTDVRPQVHVACLDARTGALRWRKLICANETVASGQWPEITSDLLTLAGGTLYLNTNLGAVAALSTADGEIRWIACYPRATVAETDAAHFYRDSNPCVYSRGKLFVAPTDTPNVLALDASTGALLWESPHFPETIHLIGVVGDQLIGSGKQIVWWNVDSGKVIGDSRDPTTGGYGRGALVDSEVYWPMRAQIRRCKQRISHPDELDADEPIQLDHFDPPLSGGNLVAANGYLLIATPTKLVAFGPGPSAMPQGERILTQNTTPAALH